VCHHHHVFGAPARTLGKQFERAALLGIHGRVPLTWRRRSAPPWQGARSPATARPLRRRAIAPAAWHAMRVQRRCSCHQCTPLEPGPVLGAKLPRSRCARNGADDPLQPRASALSCVVWARLCAHQLDRIQRRRFAVRSSTIFPF
jgi:hypothetical protein